MAPSGWKRPKASKRQVVKSSNAQIVVRSNSSGVRTLLYIRGDISTRKDITSQICQPFVGHSEVYMPWRVSAKPDLKREFTSGDGDEQTAEIRIRGSGWRISIRALKLPTPASSYLAIYPTKKTHVPRPSLWPML